ncbi:MAG TPA: hypothetical protein VKU94_00915 [Geobacterales bacterium]|nr:hypothetical protein [Geobacterales bacterium]
MSACEECGGKLVKADQSEFLVCSECGLLSEIRIYSFSESRSEAKKRKMKKEITYTKILKKAKLPKKYSKKLTDGMLARLKLTAMEQNNSKELRMRIYEMIRTQHKELMNDEFLRIGKAYKNVAKVFLNGNGAEPIFEAIALMYYLRKNNINMSFDKVAKMFNLAKNNLFRRYKEFEERIKIYERQGLKRLVVMKMLGQARLKYLTLKEIALIAGVRHDSARVVQMKIKRMNIVDEKGLMRILVGP